MWVTRGGVRKVYFNPYDLQRMFDRGKEPMFLQQMYDNKKEWPDSDFSKTYDDIFSEQHAIINSFGTQTRRDRGMQTGQIDKVDQGTPTGEDGIPNLPLDQRTGAKQEVVYRPRI